jgi:hypothetical protein
MAEKKYIVADGCSFVGNKKTYKEGDEIDASAFKNKERFESFLSGKNPKIIPSPAGGEKEKQAKIDRKELEKLALDNGLVKKEQVSTVKDDELEKMLKDAGFLN